MATWALLVMVYQAKVERKLHWRCSWHNAMSEIDAQANNDVRGRKKGVSVPGKRRMSRVRLRSLVYGRKQVTELADVLLPASFGLVWTVASLGG